MYMAENEGAVDMTEEAAAGDDTAAVMDTEGADEDGDAMQMAMPMQGEGEDKAVEGGQLFQDLAFVNQVQGISICIYMCESISHC